MKIKNMKIRIASILSAASLAFIFLTCGSTVSFGIDCDVRAYVADQDRNGVNVRDLPSKDGEIMGLIPFYKEGTYVHIVAMENSANGWVQIDKAETVSQRISFTGNGWVSGNTLAMSIRGVEGGVKLYQDGNKQSKVLARIPLETEVRIAGCDGKWALVKYKSFVGWLQPDDQCATLEGVCN